MTSCESVAWNEDPRFRSLRSLLGKDLRCATIGEFISTIDRWDADEVAGQKGHLEFLVLFAALAHEFAELWDEADGEDATPLQTRWERVPASAVRLAFSMMPATLLDERVMGSG